jgi:hypothetical protein
MAELNFGLLTPPGSQSIGNAFVSGMDQARAAQMQDMQMQQSVRKGQMDELQFRKAQEAEAKLNQFYAHVADNGGPKDPVAIEDAMIKSGIPNVADAGLTARMARLKLEQSRRQYVAANAMGTAPAPAVAPATASFGAEVATRKAQLFGPPPGRTNMMPGAAVAPADVNVLPATVAPPQVKTQIDFLRERIDANLALGTDQGYKTAENLQKQLTELNRRYTVGNTLMGSEGNVFNTAPQLPQQPRQVNLAADLLIPGPNGTMVPNTALIGVKTGLQRAGAPNVTAAFTNVQPDGNGGFIGLSKKTNKMEKIPQDANVVAGGQISGDALELAAQGYLMDRKLPTNLGRGQQGARNTIKIMDRAAALAKESGMTSEETAINQILAKAKSLALAQNTKDLAAIRPYNAMLEKNGDIAISLAEKAISTNAKLANRSINWLKQNASDNPDVAEFLAQARIVTTEAARVLNNPRLVGQLTDSARHEMEGILNGDMPLESFTRVVRRLQSDGKNRVDAMVEENNSLKQSIRRPNAAGQAAPAGAGKPSLDFIFGKKKP